jgi:hypothetical protein
VIQFITRSLRDYEKGLRPADDQTMVALRCLSES